LGSGETKIKKCGKLVCFLSRFEVNCNGRD
jgi:hypothetical protein